MLPGLLTGKTVLVTGAASGIGREVARACATGGARIVLCDRDSKMLAESVATLPAVDAPHEIAFCDVTDSASVVSAFANKGRIDAVVNCAGIWRLGPDGSLGKLEDNIWQEILDVNLTGTMKVCREAVRHMADQGGGSIVTIASIVALKGWNKVNAYTASKGGVLSFSRGLAVETGPHNIRVNCICPGQTETPMTEEVLKYSQPIGLPLGRIGQPADTANVAAFLCSDFASFVTGATVPVDGGGSAA